MQNWNGVDWKGNPVPVGAKFQYTLEGHTDICYYESSGCRIEKVTVMMTALEAGPTKVYLDPYYEKLQQAAVAKALSKLGAEGWELVGSGPDPAALRAPSQMEPVAPLRSILYLKRMKT